MDLTKLESEINHVSSLRQGLKKYIKKHVDDQAYLCLLDDYLCKTQLRLSNYHSQLEKSAEHSNPNIDDIKKLGSLFKDILNSREGR